MPLNTEIDTLGSMGERIRSAFLVSDHAAGVESFGDSYDNVWAFLEHGQWWVEDTRTGAQWSVVVATGGRSVDGFDFEKVCEGER